MLNNKLCPLDLQQVYLWILEIAYLYFRKGANEY